MAFRKQRIDTRKLTPTLINEFVTMEAAPQDRIISPRRIQVLKAACERNEFRTCQWASVFCKQTGKIYRVNGKHTSNLFSQMNGERPKDIEVVIERYECDTLADVARLYSTFDTRESNRSTADINRAYAASVKELADVAAFAVNICVTGIEYSVSGESSSRNLAADRAEQAMKETAFIVWADTVLTLKHLKRSAVVAAMFLTWKKSQKDSNEFWLMVRDGTGSTPSCPTRKLEKFLLTNMVKGSQKDKSVTTREMHVKCLHAWNAWRKGATTDLRYVPANDNPTVI